MAEDEKKKEEKTNKEEVKGGTNQKADQKNNPKGDQKQSPKGNQNASPKGSQKPSPKGSPKENPVDAAKDPKNINKMEEIIAKNDQDNAASKLNDSTDTVLVLCERPAWEEEFSIWRINTYLHSRYRNVPAIIRYFLEILVILIIVLVIPFIVLYLQRVTPNIKELFTRKQSNDSLWNWVLKVDVFLCTWYIADIFICLFTDGFIHTAGVVLQILQLYQSELCWRIVQTAYTKRKYIRVAATCFFAFFLSNVMFSKYERPEITSVNIEMYAKTILLWFGIHNLLLFTVKFVVNISTYDIKQSVYRDAIIDINSKSFIFYKLKCISEAAPDRSEMKSLIDNFSSEYDTGFSLKYLDLFESEEDAKIVATNILVLLKIKTLTKDQVKRLFPDNPEPVYKYLSDSSNNEDKSSGIKTKQFVALATELYRVRRDMSRSLRDRDSIYEKLELIFTLITLFLSLIILMILFQMEYRVFIASFGTSLFTFSWIFADSIKTIYNCFIFLLIIRPYTIGDRVIVDKEIMVVYKVDLFTTTFLSLDKKVVYIPNSKLIASNIANLARSPPQKDILELTVDAGTTYDAAEKLQETAKEMLLKEKQMFTDCEFIKLAGGVLSFAISHTKNFQNFASLYARRDKSIKIIRKAMAKTGISYKESYIFL